MLLYQFKSVEYDLKVIEDCKLSRAPKVKAETGSYGYMSLSSEFLIALGRISVNFQVLELYVGILTWSLISLGERIGQIVTSQLFFNRLCDLLASLFPLSSA
jgi:hypothetical protein